MATKASGTLVLIIERQHASCGLMVTALPGLELTHTLLSTSFCRRAAYCSRMRLEIMRRCSLWLQCPCFCLSSLSL